ncbi:uncharacterized protein Z520_08939 [Fonsecaea multimorphosa CBS 102226]|uniref:AMP-dependent synthetase/ligase domain-containing protein n=1 Tax=Fonsecaea multimorphosa CBS 102226 TaxID=1442371 RepID=A0A0D2JQ07_9EURO|nr:uncharacterized protein Z520_08939 [Fonsecaea multimorphosa CBS 102226]KIX95422.1 hypothetical protein Z520_08939 [Fonsecaea multimorphosa CBS 102226]OAL20954.1 hypothetical protein AYO22_08374 [Fonsecaea multimorphosa]
MPADSNNPPPGRRLFPVAIDDIAQSDPTRTLASIPLSSDLSHGYRDVSFLSFANAVNRAAWFIETTFGRSANSPTLAYIGKSDMRYHILAMAAAKTGYQVLFSSHINSLAAHLNLLQLCDCHLFLSAEGVDVADILAARSMNHAICPELNELLDPSPADKYQMRKTFDQAAQDTFLILHSSGTTGLPKPIRITHAQMAANDQITHLPEECQCGGPGFRRLNPINITAGRLIVPFAPFHVISAILLMCYTVFGKTTYVFGPSDRSMNATDLLDAVEYGKGDCIFCAPAFLEKYASSERDLARLSRLSSITYGGGVLSPRAAAILTDRLKNTTFIQFFGATESGCWILYQIGTEDMEYLSIDACHMGIEWRPVAADSDTQSPADGDSKSQPAAPTLYEPVIVRFKDPTAASRQTVFQTFPELDEYATGDLFAPHPSRPNTWKFAGRVDDLILFGHGIKFHPAGIEAKIQHSHDWIREVLLWGDGHQQVITLIELTDEGLREVESGGPVAAQFQNEIDLLFDKVNDEAPLIAKLAKTHVIFATREKPLPRTSKGSLRRKEAARVYQAEIDQVYRVHGDQMMGSMMSRVHQLPKPSN